MARLLATQCDKQGRMKHEKGMIGQGIPLGFLLRSKLGCFNNVLTVEWTERLLN